MDKYCWRLASVFKNQESLIPLQFRHFKFPFYNNNIQQSRIIFLPFHLFCGGLSLKTPKRENICYFYVRKSFLKSHHCQWTMRFLTDQQPQVRLGSSSTRWVFSAHSTLHKMTAPQSHQQTGHCPRSLIWSQAMMTGGGSAGPPVQSEPPEDCGQDCWLLANNHHTTSPHHPQQHCVYCGSLPVPRSHPYQSLHTDTVRKMARQRL